MNETEIPTPRTDAFIVEHQGWGPTDWNWRCFARQLERENAAMRDIFPKILEACQNGSGCLPEVSLWFLSGISEEVRLVVSGLKQENAAMREVIESAGEALLAFNDVGACKAFYDMKDQSLELLKPYLP